MGWRIGGGGISLIMEWVEERGMDDERNRSVEYFVRGIFESRISGEILVSCDFFDRGENVVWEKDLVEFFASFLTVVVGDVYKNRDSIFVIGSIVGITLAWR